MQTPGNQRVRNLNSLNELLAAFKQVKTADAAGPLPRSQSELALAAVTNASSTEGVCSPQLVLSPSRYKNPRSSSLPISVPMFAAMHHPQPAPSGSSCGSSCSATYLDGELTLLPRSAESHPGKAPIKTYLYKTEMCRGWEATGRCRYGNKCQFAHGHHELQPVMRHPKYKIEICRPYAQTGFCRYGKRCRFIHPETTTDGFFTQHMHDQADMPQAALSPQMSAPKSNQDTVQGLPSYSLEQTTPHFIAPSIHGSPVTQCSPQSFLPSDSFPCDLNHAQLTAMMATPKQQHLMYSPSPSELPSMLSPYAPSVSRTDRFDQPSQLAPAYSQIGETPVGSVSPPLLGSGYGSSSDWLGTDEQQHLRNGQLHPSPKSVFEHAAGCNHDQVC